MRAQPTGWRPSRAAARPSAASSVLAATRRIVSPRFVRAAHRAGRAVYVWTVDDEEEMKTFIAWGVDGIYTNKPMVLKAVVNAECGVRRAEEGRGTPRA